MFHILFPALRFAVHVKTHTVLSVALKLKKIIKYFSNGLHHGTFCLLDKSHEHPAVYI